MRVVGSDGYEYESVKDRLLERPTDNRRNRAVKLYRRQHYTEVSVKAFYEAFDKAFAEKGCDSEEVLDAALSAARATGCFGPLVYKYAPSHPLSISLDPACRPELRSRIRERILGPIR